MTKASRKKTPKKERNEKRKRNSLVTLINYLAIYLCESHIKSREKITPSCHAYLIYFKFLSHRSLRNRSIDVMSNPPSKQEPLRLILRTPQDLRNSIPDEPSQTGKHHSLQDRFAFLNSPLPRLQ